MKASRTLLGIVAAALTLGASSPNPSIERIEKGLRPPVLIEGDKTWTLEERMRLFHVPGLSVAVFRDFQLSWAKAYGFADEAAGTKATDVTLFQAGSVSKPVAAMGALKLVEEGTLSLDKDIHTYLKGWKIPENDLTKKTPVTPNMTESLRTCTGRNQGGQPRIIAVSGETSPPARRRGRDRGRASPSRARRPADA